MNAQQASITQIQPTVSTRRSRALERIRRNESQPRHTRQVIIHPEFEHGHDTLCADGWPEEIEATLFVRVSSDPLARATLVTMARFKDGFLFVLQRLIEGPLLEVGPAADEIIDFALRNENETNKRPARLVFSADLNTCSTHCTHVLATLADALGLSFAPVSDDFDIAETERQLGVYRDGFLSEPASAHLTLFCYGPDEGPAGTDREERLGASFDASRVDILTLVAAADRALLF